MADFELEKLLAPISPDSPSGEDLSYDPEYMELERAIQGTGERQMGDAVIEAEEPNWNEIRKTALDLMKRTRDLRVITFFTVAALKKSGIPGLRDGLTLLKESLDRYWDNVHPVLDPDDGYDPTERMNILASLSIKGGFQDPIAFTRKLSEATLVSVPGIGSYGFRDWLIATGRVPHPEGATNLPTEGLIAGAFASADRDAVSATAAAAAEARSAFAGINQIILARVGANRAPDLSELESVISGIAGLLQGRGSHSSPAAPVAVEQSKTSPVSQSGSAPQQAAQQVQMVPGEVNSREDVVDAIDRICRYYDKYEPSSPIPLLLKRARRLVAKDFLEIIRDISPDALPAVHGLGGITPPEDGSAG